MQKTVAVIMCCAGLAFGLTAGWLTINSALLQYGYGMTVLPEHNGDAVGAVIFMYMAGIVLVACGITIWNAAR